MGVFTHNRDMARRVGALHHPWFEWLLSFLSFSNGWLMTLSFLSLNPPLLEQDSHTHATCLALSTEGYVLPWIDLERPLPLFRPVVRLLVLAAAVSCPHTMNLTKANHRAFDTSFPRAKGGYLFRCMLTCVLLGLHPLSGNICNLPCVPGGTSCRLSVLVSLHHGSRLPIGFEELAHVVVLMLVVVVRPQLFPCFFYCVCERRVLVPRFEVRTYYVPRPALSCNGQTRRPCRQALLNSAGPDLCIHERMGRWPYYNSGNTPEACSRL